jgi:hypothetical protein
MVALRTGALVVSAAVFVLLGALGPGAARALDGRGYLELDAGYKTGDFGTPTTANLFYLSPTLGYVAPRFDVSVTAPLLSLTEKTSGSSTTETGLGDVVLRAGAVLLTETSGGLSINGAAAVKLPTADEAKGLGTGQTDFGVFAGLYQRLIGLKVSLKGGYIVTGDPSGVTYKDIPLAGIGVSKVFGMTNVFAALEGRGATVATAKDPLEASLGVFHILNRDYSLAGSVTFGLNSGGPAFGATIGVVRWL